MIEDGYSVNELFNQFMHLVLDLLSFINNSLLFICIDFVLVARFMYNI
jgi:hypothetical protein